MQYRGDPTNCLNITEKNLIVFDDELLILTLCAVCVARNSRVPVAMLGALYM